MYPDIEYVMRRRYAVSVILRCFAIVLFLLGSIPLLQALLQYGLIALYDTFWMPTYRGNLGNSDVLLYIIPELCKYAIPAVLILFFRLRIVRWIVPLPKPECPHCGYNIAKLAEPRCPECGLDLPGEMVSQPDSDRVAANE